MLHQPTPRRLLPYQSSYQLKFSYQHQTISSLITASSGTISLWKTPEPHTRAPSSPMTLNIHSFPSTSRCPVTSRYLRRQQYYSQYFLEDWPVSWLHQRFLSSGRTPLSPTEKYGPRHGSFSVVSSICSLRVRYNSYSVLNSNQLTYSL